MKHILNDYKSKNNLNILQVVAYKDNKLEIEAYRNDFNRSDTMNVMSVTKSVASILLGIAIDKGYIKSVDEKIMDYLYFK